MYVDIGIVAVCVCGQWHCCLSVDSDIVAVCLWTVALLLFFCRQSHYYCLCLWTIHCYCLYLWTETLLLFMCVWTVIRKLVDGTCLQCEELCEGAESSLTDSAAPHRLWTCRYSYF
jgi:hypothetical protein